MAAIGDGLVPGDHLGVVQVLMQGEQTSDPGPYESQLYMPLGVHPINVYAEV